MPGIAFGFGLLLFLASSPNWAAESAAVIIDLNDDDMLVDTSHRFFDQLGKPVYVADTTSNSGTREIDDWAETATNPEKGATEHPLALVISGHHTQGEFSGTSGSFKITQLPPPPPNHWRARVTHIYADGCNTATLALVTRDGAWRRAFPNARVIVGYNGKSPLKEQRGDTRDVSGLLDLLYAASDDSDDVLAAQFAATNNWRWANTAVWTAGEANNDWRYFDASQARSKKAALRFSALRRECDAQYANLEEMTRSVGELSSRSLSEREALSARFRRVYDWAAKWDYCEQYGDWAYPDALTPKRVLLLVYWSNAVKAFEKAYGAIAASSLAIDYEESVGMPLPQPTVFTSELPQQAVERLLLDHITATHSPDYSPACGARQTIENYLEALKALAQLEHHRVPLRWMVNPELAQPLLQRTQPSLTGTLNSPC